jgi:hypothetical protein
MVGGAVALGESLRLLAVLAEGPAAGDAASPAWPEFAAYDCTSCHHELQSASGWAPAKGAWRPGRPRFPQWPLVLARAADATVDEHLAPLWQALQQQPFGRREQVTGAALAGAVWAERLAERLKQQVFEADDVAVLLQRLSGAAAEATDYESARQLAGAIDVLYCELVKIAPEHPLVTDAKAAVEKELGPLRRQLNLARPPGNSEPIVAVLSAALAQRSQTSGAAVRGHAQRLRAVFAPAGEQENTRAGAE